MVGSRTATALTGLLASLLVSAALWWYFDTIAFLVLVSFVPFLFRSSTRERSSPSHRTCPRCGFATRDRSFDYCPRDGTRLERSD